MADFEGFRGGQKPPVTEGSSDAYHDFIRWLEDHNYCKVVKCERCYFWGDLHTDLAYKFPCDRCRKHKIDTYHDDYCSDAVEVKKSEF